MRERQHARGGKAGGGYTVLAAAVVRTSLRETPAVRNSSAP